MPVYDMPLSVAGIDAVIRELESFRDRLNDASERVVRELAHDAENDMSARLSSVADPDGNVDARVQSNVSGNEATVSLTGSQAAFLEFGTGVVGRTSPHEMAGRVGWNYASGAKIRSFKNGRIGWVYFDQSRRHYRVTSGIAAQNIVIGASATTRTMIARRIREALR